METSVKDRLIKFLEVKKISKSEFGRRIGVSSAYITSMRQSMQPDKVQRIALEFPDLNTTWLLTGEGPMLKESSTLIAPADSETVSIPREAWEVIRSQAASLEMKDKQMSEMLMMLKEHFGYPTETTAENWPFERIRTNPGLKNPPPTTTDIKR